MKIAQRGGNGRRSIAKRQLWLNASLWLLAALPAPALTATAGAAESAVKRGEVHYVPPQREQNVPERYRLPDHRFRFEQRPLPKQSIEGKVDVWGVTFPSPVTTPEAANNTVHCEYFEPLEPAAAERPAVVVLHILGGEFALSRLFCMALARKGVASLFLKMPYYGPRRTVGSERRMISADTEQTVAAMTQAVLDIRCGVAWLTSRDDVDAKRIGIFGVSLGGIMGGLAAASEPRIGQVCLALAGGDFARIAWESAELSEMRKQWLAKGATREEFEKKVGVIDPARYGANVRGRRILMLNAKEDRVIPRECAETLWKSYGRPKIIWYEGGHYSVGKYLLHVTTRVSDFFAEPIE